MFQTLSLLVQILCGVIATIDEQGKLTPELKERIEECFDSTTLEDIYLPYKPKRKTRADVAREKGLEPLAKIIMSQQYGNVEDKSARFVKGDVKSADDALQGARDIIAEWINEDEWVRNSVRKVFQYDAILTSKVVKGKETEGDKYRDYFDWSEPLARCSSHRMLAIRRGEKEGFLRVTIAPADDANAIERLERQYVRTSGECAEQVALAVRDGYKRLLRPSIETEFANSSKQKADEEAIRVFAGNLRQLLLAPPLGQKRVMGIDPGYRTGCKVVCLDAQGNLLLTRTNASGARVAGMNVEAKVGYGHLLTFQAGYTYNHSRYIEPLQWSENPNITPQRRMFRTPDHYGYFLCNIEPTKNFHIVTNGKVTGSMLVQHFAGYVPEDEEVKTPTFFEWDVKLCYDIPLYKHYTLEINAGVKNILDNFQKDIDKGMDRDAGYVYGPATPRTFFAGVNLKI